MTETLMWLGLGESKEQGRFDKKHGEGSARRFMELCETQGYRVAAATFGYKSRQAAYWCYQLLTGGKKKPHPQARRDITPEVLEELAKNCASAKEMAARLSVNPGTITAIARRFRITLPSERRAVALRERIKPLAEQGLNAYAIARAIGVHHMTIYNYNDRYQLGVMFRWRRRKKAVEPSAS